MQIYKEIESYSELTKLVDCIAIDESNPKSFGSIEIGGKKFGLAWDGSSKPEMDNSLDLELVLIGVGSSVVIISTEKGTIKFSMGLNNPFAFFLVDTKRVVIVSETTITIVNQNTFSLERFTGVPDIIVDGRIEGEKIIINGMDEDFKF